MLVLLETVAASGLLHLHLHLDALLLLSPLLLLALLVCVQHVVDPLPLQEGDALVQDIQVHLDDLRLAHERNVGLAVFIYGPQHRPVWLELLPHFRLASREQKLELE